MDMHRKVGHVPRLKLYYKNRLCRQNVHIKSQIARLMFDVTADDGSWEHVVN